MRKHIYLLVACFLQVSPVQAGRLSDWLNEQAVVHDAYPLGLMWQVGSEKNTQRVLKSSVLKDIAQLPVVDGEEPRKLATLIQGMPVTGRVPVPSADLAWLFANPAADPVIGSDDQVIMPVRPKTVTVITANGQICSVPHRAGLYSQDYLAQCPAPSRVDYAYVAQADGKTARYGIAAWNSERQPEPAPGAWIWAPSAAWPDGISRKLITFLATQGPAPDAFGNVGGGTEPRLQVSSEDKVPSLYQSKPAPRSRTVTANNWGEAGLIQTPTARMRDEGEFLFNLTRSFPYTYINVGFQPFAWMEAAFRYTSVSNRLYGPLIAGGQAYKDKSIDVKLRMMEESAYGPELAVGIRDLAGTGQFSGEYLVANKRAGDLDWDLGLGWGYLGSRANANNPLGVLSPGFKNRPKVVVGQGGNFAVKNYFRGPAAWFGGMQYQTPWDPLILKLEYNGNNYQHEPQNNNFVLKSPWNLAMVYQLSESMDIVAGIERGNTAMLGLTMHSALNRLTNPKLDDVPRVPVVAERAAVAPDWAVTGRAIEAQTNWHVQSIVQQGNILFITIDEADVVYWRDYLDRAVAVLHRDTPYSIDQFRVIYRQHGLTVAEHVVDRGAWVYARTQFLAPSQHNAEVLAIPPQTLPAGSYHYLRARPSFTYDVGMSFNYSLGGPNGFVLFQMGPVAKAQLNFTDNTWMQGNVQLDVLDNYNKFVFNGFSNLPRVRTNVRQYVTTSKATMPNLQLTHMNQLSEGQYFSLYGGYLESMFAGVGAEWLYRPVDSRYAVGIDVNEVRQRDFAQKLALQPYRVKTGHLTGYFDTGWKDVQAKLSVGQYLAGDKGVTIDMSRVFDNGVKMGGYFTKTNVTAQQFGEGSFDKGIYFQIPFDAMLTKSVGGSANIMWQPLMRDGGAKLLRAVQLYDLTNARDDRALRYKPAPPDERDTIPEQHSSGIEPQTIVVPVRSTELKAAGSSSDQQSDYALKLQTALYGLDFRHIKLNFDGATLQAKLENDRVRPISKAVGLAARTMLNFAPPATRKIRIIYALHAEPAIVYDFPNLDILRSHFAGTANSLELRNSTAIGVINPAAESDAPLALFDDLTPAKEASLMEVLLPETGPVARVVRDYSNAAKLAWKSDWMSSAAVGAGLVFVSGLYDKKADGIARNHANSVTLKRFNNIGNALPWLEAAGAAFMAVGSSDPRLSRTSYAASEAALASFATAVGLKYAVGRARPVANLGSRNFSAFAGSAQKNTDSFPSGHTIIAWSVLTPYAEEYDAPWLYGLAAVTNLARVGGRNHWVSDTVAGSLLGYGIGDLFWRSSLRHRDVPRIMLTPSSIDAVWELQ